MKFHLILALCLGGVADVLGEGSRINLEDIERDNLRSESKSGRERSDVEDTRNAESTSNDNDYNVEQRTNAGILEKPRDERMKYTETYQRTENYATQPNYRTLQFYGTYQPEEAAEAAKVSRQFSDEARYPQPVTYRTEIPIGNRLQGIQQKTATQKFVQALSKVTSVNTNGVVNEPSSSHRNVKILNVPTFSPRETNVPGYDSSHVTERLNRFNYETRDEPQYQRYVASYVPEISVRDERYQQSVYSSPTTVTKETTSPYRVNNVDPRDNYQSRIYLQLDQIPVTYGSTGTKLSSYYANPSSRYEGYYRFSDNDRQLERLYADLREKNQIFQQQGNIMGYTNLIRGGQHSYTTALPQRYYVVPSSYSNEDTRIKYNDSPIYRGNFNIGENYLEIPTDVSTKASLEHGKYENGGDFKFVPRSLLESYTPSHVVAARDSERYRERSLKIENESSATSKISSFIDSQRDNGKS